MTFEVFLAQFMVKHQGRPSEAMTAHLREAWEAGRRDGQREVGAAVLPMVLFVVTAAGGVMTREGAYAALDQSNEMLAEVLGVDYEAMLRKHAGVPPKSESN